VLRRIVNEGGLPAAALSEVDPYSGLPLPKHHEAIAKALESYLARSGEFSYTLQLQRRDRNIDPVEDFLYNTKSGHCQRFATGLTLMLRSLGIPAQLVLGFRGGESHGDGWYTVRQSHAHAWVEVLVPRSPPSNTVPRLPGESPPNPSTIAYHLLSLDPTPTGDPTAGASETSDNWLDTALAKGESFFRHFVLAYDSVAREQALDAAVESLEEFAASIVSGERSWPIIVVVSGLALAFGRFAYRRHRLRQRDVDAGVERRREVARTAPFYGRLSKLLAIYGHDHRLGETAREFAARVAAMLAADPLTAPAATVPILIADAYYRVRFGGHELTDDERRDLDEALLHLETSLSRVTHRNDAA
jgi:hypothetical protein